MSSSLGAMDFFALEAGEYLERLATIVAQEEGPKRDEFVRFARALRGSALMANQADFASAAGGLEAIARAYRDSSLAWDAAVREGAAQGIETLKELLRKAATWSQAETQKAARLARDMEEVAGQPGPATHRRSTDVDPGGLNTGVRAFVAREGALIASALERAGRSLAADPADAEPIHNAVRRMQSLRGLAELTDLSPLPEMLEGLEMAAASLTRMHAHPPDVASVFRLGAEAMTRASRDVAHQGRPEPESDEAKKFSQVLIDAFALEDDVVSIATLAPAGGESIVAAGNPPPNPTHPGAVEIVSQGEHLVRLADTLLSAGSLVERQLRLLAVIDTLRGLDARIGRLLGSAFDAFADAAKATLRTADESEGLTSFGQSLRESGQTLKQYSDENSHGAAVAKLEAMATGLGTAGAIAEPASPAVQEAEEHVVSIADLAPSQDVAGESPFGVPASAPAVTSEEVGLAASFATYHQLLMAGRTAEPSLAGVSQPVAQPVAEEQVVDIDTLLYRGAAAQERAKHLGREISECLDRPGIFLGLRPLLEELLDLLPRADEPVIG